MRRSSAPPLTPVARLGYGMLYHEGHPSTAVHRAVGRALFEELAARGRAAAAAR